jgi:general secretion pathway protein F/type IV pilus assembly protein PilC
MGKALSKALEDFPESFSPLYRALISAGEAVGNLELALSRLTTLLSSQQKASKQLISALTYPLFLFGLMLVAITILVGFVVPSLEQLFEGRNLPWFTSVVFSLSATLRNHWAVLVGGIISSITFLYFYLKRPQVKQQLQRNLLRLPVIGRYIIHSSLARFARTLSSLLDGGLPLTTSLSFAQEGLYNVRLEEVIESVSNKVIEGKTISGELAHYKEIPSLFTRMVKIGEESGKLATMLSQVALIYEEETERSLQLIVSLSQPVLLIVMGGAIGAVILSVLMPLADVQSLLQA